ncbi:putative subtilisin-like proteinase 1 [Nosema granulosis]|uniref:Subtilisin-like proteinase 1 n=1 Tax=Nosema granulosis TaxID=83296 RepID=A0A9P6GZ12_9MICR|nr:putative subtilisin-like proteinase 1 [Nosema granulosis]
MKILFIITVILCRDSYIVMFKRNRRLNKMSAQAALENNIIRTMSHFDGSDQIKHYVSNGYVAELSESTVKKLRADSSVQLAEKDRMVKIADYKIFDIVLNVDEDPNIKVKIKKQYNAPWGLSRVTGIDYFKHHLFLYPSNSGQDVDVYVIDTGVAVDHPEFQGRARWGANLVDGSPDKDENGHGTHCAGVIASKSFGIAKNANITAIKVLDRDGSGMISRIIAGIDFVIDEHESKKDLLYDMATAKFLSKNSKESNLNEKIEKFINESDLLPKSVVNMSVGGERSAALNFAIDYAVSLGIHFSVAAGNERKNACAFSPGSSKHAITTGASTKKDTTADFSNFGKCVDLYAPGVDIISTWNDKGSRMASGTSMAAPHTTGAMAMYLSSYQYSPENLKKQIIKDTQNAIKECESGNSFYNIWPLNILFSKDKLPLLSIQNLLKKIESIN